MCNAIADSTLKVLQLFKEEPLSIEEAYQKLGSEVAYLNLGDGTTLARFIVMYASTGALEEVEDDRYRLSEEGERILQRTEELSNAGKKLILA